jgi:hypothetical protein
MQDYTTDQEITTLIQNANTERDSSIRVGCCSGVPNLAAAICNTASTHHHAVITSHTWQDFIAWRKNINPHTNITSDSLTATYASFMHWYMSAYPQKKIRRRCRKSSLTPPPPPA